MTVEKEDLGLTLSLSFPHTNHQPPQQLNLSPPFAFNLRKPQPGEAFHFPSSDRNAGSETRAAFLLGIDVNRLPPPATPSTAAAECCEEEAGVSSPNSTISTVSGKRSEREMNGEDQEMERDSSRSDEEDGDNSRKKLRLSKDQSAVLEESFREHNTLNPKQKLALAKQLGLRPRQVEVWFQNRRARTKLKQTEIDCEFLKRCCENLTEENRRLQKEVQELRALKLSPQFYMHMTPPTTLTMCPSCERVAAPPPTTSEPRPAQHHHPHLHQQQRSGPINPWAPRPTVPVVRGGLQPRS